MTDRQSAILLAIVVLLMPCSTTRGQETSKPELQRRLQQVLRWLPIDSETLFVANKPFAIPRKADQNASFQASAQSVAFSAVIGLQDRLLQKALEGQKVLFAVEAS